MVIAKFHHLSAGFLEPNEQKILENMETNSNKYFVPLIWSASLVLRARKEGRIKDDFSVKTLIDVSCSNLYPDIMVMIVIIVMIIILLLFYYSNSHH